jgi:hypothetical protein
MIKTFLDNIGVDNMHYKILRNSELTHIIKYNGNFEKESNLFFSKYNIDNFRIKNWKDDVGKNYHPLLKDSPLIVTNIWREKLLEIEAEIDSIFEGPYHLEDIESGKARYKSFNEIPKDIEQKIMSIVAKDLDIDNEFYQFSILENQTGFVKDETQWRPEDAGQYWHIDSQMRQTLRCIVYLSDVEDELDGPFEYIDRPEERHFNIDAIHEFNNIDPNPVIIDTYLQNLQSEKKVKMYGPKYTAVIFDPSCIHKANYPIRKPRRVLMFDVKRKNNISYIMKDIIKRIKEELESGI